MSFGQETGSTHLYPSSAQLIVIWVVWLLYLPPPKVLAYCDLGGRALLYSLARKMIVIWVVVPSPPSLLALS